MSMQPESPLPWGLKIINDREYYGKMETMYLVYSESFPEPNSSLHDGIVFHDETYYPVSPKEKDAAFIVHACNMHNELVDALEVLLHEHNDLFKSATGNESIFVNEVNKILSKAKGEQ